MIEYSPCERLETISRPESVVAEFRVSPSQIARYYFHECERYLRYRSATKARRTADDIPEFEVDRSLLTRAILEGGALWEQRILAERLGSAVAIATTKDGFGEARHSADATVAWLERARPGVCARTSRRTGRRYRDHEFDDGHS